MRRDCRLTGNSPVVWYVLTVYNRVTRHDTRTVTLKVSEVYRISKRHTYKTCLLQLNDLSHTYYIIFRCQLEMVIEIL